MSTVLVTGSTGFIGKHITNALLRNGYHVRSLVRSSPGAKTDNHMLDRVSGDIGDRASLIEAMDGCDGVIHTAGLYTFGASERLLHQVNVEGTRNVLQAASDVGVKRVVYTSTVSTVRLNRDGNLGDETEDARPQDLVGPYKRTKFEAEMVARQFAWQGTPVIVVNPTAPIGAGDAKPTPTGNIILEFLRNRLPAYINTGLNLIDVNDVAIGHILALEKGVVGQRYLLGNIEGNLTLARLLYTLQELTGLPAPRHRIPWALAIMAAYVDHLLEGIVLRRQPRIPLEGTRMARKFMWVDPSKAVQELGLPQHSIIEALRNSVIWYVESGYAPKPPLISMSS